MLALIFIALTSLGLFVGLFALIAFLGRPHISRAAGRALTTVVGVSALGFCWAFVGAGQPHTAFNSAAVIAFLLVVLAAIVIVARMPPDWAPLLVGVMVAGTFIAAVLGDYSAHAAGWNGLRLDVSVSDDRSRWGEAMLRIIFWSPAIFGVGVVVGTIARAVPLRRSTPSS